MLKKALALLLMMSAVAAFARTKEEIQKELAPLNVKYWHFSSTKEYSQYEKDIMMKDADYVAAKKAETEAIAARAAFIDAEMSKTPEGKKLVEARIAAEKALDAATGGDRNTALAALRKARTDCNNYSREKELTAWSNEAYRKVHLAMMNSNKVRLNAGLAALENSGNAEAKAFAQSYKDLEAKIMQLREELKTAK